MYKQMYFLMLKHVTMYFFHVYFNCMKPTNKAVHGVNTFVRNESSFDKFKVR